MERAGIWYLRAFVLGLKARGLVGLGTAHLDAARDVMQDARSVAETLGSRRAIWSLLVRLVEIARESNDLAAAAILEQEARTVVAEIAQQTST
jgi:hypothetical protein